MSVPVEQIICIHSRKRVQHTSPNIILNEELSTVTSVDTIVVVIKDTVEDVAMAEAEGRSTRVEVEPIIEGIGYSDGYILSSIAVGMPNKRSLPVSVELAVSDCDTSTTVCNVEKTIITGFMN